MANKNEEEPAIPLAEIRRRIEENGKRASEEDEEPMVPNPGDGAVIEVLEGFEDETREFVEKRRKLGLIKPPLR